MRPSCRTAILAAAALAALPVAAARAGMQTLYAPPHTADHPSGQKLTAAADGSFQATWVELVARVRPAATRLLGADAAPGAAAFGPARTLYRFSSTERPGGFATDGAGNRYVVWSAGFTSSKRPSHKRGAWFAVVHPDGSRTHAQRLSRAGHYAFYPTVAGNAAGALVACWSQVVHGWQVLCSLRRPGRRRFEAPQTLYGAGHQPSHFEPYVAENGGVLAVYQLSGSPPGHSGLLAAEGDVRHGTSAGASVVADSDTPILDAAVVAPDGSATIAYTRQIGGTGEEATDTEQDVVRLAPGGQTAERQVLAAHGGGARLAELTDGSVLVAFAGNGNLTVEHAPADPSAPFGSPRALGPVNAPFDLASGPGNTAAATWSVGFPDPASSAASHVQIARYDGSSWAAPSAVAAVASFATPLVALASPSRAAILWTVGPGRSLYAAIP